MIRRLSAPLVAEARLLAGIRPLAKATPECSSWAASGFLLAPSSASVSSNTSSSSWRALPITTATTTDPKITASSSSSAVSSSSTPWRLNEQRRAFASRSAARRGTNFVAGPPLVTAGHSLHESAREAFNKKTQSIRGGRVPDPNGNNNNNNGGASGPNSSGPTGGSGTAQHSASAWAALLARYLLLCRARPVFAVAATSFVLWGLGDVTTQLLERFIAQAKRRAPGGEADAGLPLPLDGGLNTRRLAATLAFGTAVAGVGGHYWYRLLDHVVLHRLRLVEGSARFIGAKLALECVLWHPVGLSLFWAAQGVGAEGKSLWEVKRELGHDLLPALAVEVGMWTPVDIINFRFTPVHLQVIVVNFVSFFEAIVLSYLHSEVLGGNRD